MPVVASSNLIRCLAEARDYYRANLAGVRRVTCYGSRIEVVFPVDVIHVYSESGQAIEGVEIVTQQIGIGKFEVRNFSLKRARLMDAVLPAISLFTVSILGQGAAGRRNKVLHGPRLPSNEYMRVVLRPGPKRAWTCVSAFPVNHTTYKQAWNSKRAKFPP